MLARYAMCRCALAALFILAACAGSNTQAEPGSAGRDLSATEAAATITSEEMIERIAFLASDEMGGRDTPSEGLEMAAEYLAGEFASFGLDPAGEGGTYLQRYPLPLRVLDTTGVHFGTVDGAGQDNRMLEHGVDFFASPAAPREGVDMGHGSFVYFGRLDDESMTDSPDVRGNVMVVTLPGTPDREWRIQAARARRAAAAAGASGLLAILAPEFPSEAIARFAELASRPQRVLADPDEVPVFYISHEAARWVYSRGDFDLDTAPGIAAEGIRVTGVRAHFSAEAVAIEDSRPPNVVALLPGSDPELKDTYVVFSAHMDHVGIGPADATGDSIYNGADDDASGTAALVEVAQAFAAMPEPPARSLLFLAVSGEEKGLLGSRWFSEYPTVPIEDIVANINVDMIGRNAPDSIVVIGQEYSSLGPLVQEVAAAHPLLDLTVAADPWPEERFFFRSDHFNFVRKEIPALFFFAGVHEDYHRPSDEVEKIDGDKVARVARLIFHTANAIASDPDPPSWSDEGLNQVRALTR
ncbi:MAG TPA: M20/M25/M40 family metallo-hydrolase [Gemmatimonadota bacterium]|nr:M20/M25/M40 family metallo-hydrolase [Gemmatimonadota bacterium]